MDTHEKTKEQLIIELQELQQANNSLKVSYGKDITVCKQAEEALRASDALLQTAISILPVGLWVFNEEGKIVISSAAAQQIWAGVRYLGVDQLGEYKGWRTDNGKLIEAHEWAGARALLKGETSIEEEVEIECFDGTHKIILDTAVPLFKSDGSIVGAITINQDITERKQKEETLAKSERLLSSIYDSVGDLLFLLKVEADECYRFISVNNAYCKVTGLNEDMVVGKLMSEVIPEHSLSIVKGKHRQAIKESSTIRWEETFDYPIGQLIGDVSISPVFDEKGFCTHLVGSVHDITERRQAEEKLLKSENMLQTVLDNFPGVVFWKDRQSNYLGCNQSFATVVGLKNSAEIVGKTDFEMSWTSTEAIDYLKDDMAVMESGKGRLHIIENLRQSNGQVKWIDTCKLPLRNSLGEVIGVIGISNDISTLKMTEQELINTNKELTFQNDEKEKRAAELVLANKELVFQNEEKEKRAAELVIAKEHAEQSDRLKSAFLANMSHEIRTPMNGILGFASILKEVDLSGEEQQEYLELMEQSGARMLNIINDIVDISKIESGLMEVHLKESNINKQIDYIHTFFKPEMDKKKILFSTKKSLSGKEAVINTDREKLYAILTNLVKNAIKYTDEGSIEFGYNLKTESQTTVLEFFVRDTGIGIPKHRQEPIFERFIQADIANKMARQGAGLGLSISKAFVELLGGKIWVSSEEGKGSTFYFTLPYNTEPEEKNVVRKVVLAEGVENPINPKVSGLKILIAEDDETSEKLITISINKLSNEVIKARTGNEAVEICRKNPKIDLILMDIQMPDLNGYEATRQIRQFNNDVVIIAQTAFGLSGDREKAIEAGCNDYIAKPIDKAELLTLVQKYFKK